MVTAATRLLAGLDAASACWPSDLFGWRAIREMPDGHW